MSASIHYRKTTTADPRLKRVGAPSSFIESLQRAFGNFPCEVGPNDIPVLRGLSAAHTWEEKDDPYQEIIELVEKFGSIELYATY